MQQADPILVRGRCACGRRYRIRNAAAGVTVACPSCRRSITVTEAEVRAAFAGELLIPIQSDTTELREAIPLDFGELRIAPEGSRPGLTGKSTLDHDEALLMGALRGSNPWSSQVSSVPTAPSTARIELERTPRSFAEDLFASFYFAGSGRNALNVLATAVACAVPTFLQFFLGMAGPLAFGLTALLIPIYLIIYLYIMQFFWSTVGHTADGRDEIPWIEADWSLWDDSVKPALWVSLISILCTAPAASAYYLLGPAVPGRAGLFWLVLAGGWFFWPVAVMSMSIGNSLVFLRPDWLARCVFGIGPVYVVAWLTVMLALALWIGSYYLFARYAAFLLWIPVVGFAANLYFGYVVFRNCGLIFRHFRDRFPWRF